MAGIEIKPDAVTTADIKRYLTGLNPRGRLNGDEGTVFGLSNAEVKKVVVCWMADLGAIEYAASIGADTIVTHEALFYPYDILDKGGTLEFLSWKTNNERAKLLGANGMNVIRAHGTMDHFCIFNDFAALFQLGEPIIKEDDFVQIYEIEPITYGDMIVKVKNGVGMKLVRVTDGDRSRMVKRIGLPWGGLGLFVNAGYMQRLIHHRCDCFIAGEACNYGFRFAIGAGVDMIETSHEISENPGIKNFARALNEAFPQVCVNYYENKCPWVYE